MKAMPAELVIKSRRAILPGETSPKPAAVFIRDGKIVEVGDYQSSTAATEVIDAGDSVLMPGLIDTHVHVNEPGRTEWEGFQTATRAAAAGGITTIVDMPLNSIPATTDLPALQKKSEAARGHCSIDYGFWGGVVPQNSSQLQPMIEAGVMGFKAFLIDSGVDEFPMVTEEELRVAMPILARNSVPLLVHAEVCAQASGESTANPRSYQAYLQSRPRQWETDAIRMMIRLSRETGCWVHIVHLSAADALADLKRARSEGVKITVETCPHYLFFASENIPDGATQYKCAPPIRERENRESLWQALQDGAIDFVVSDHSPCLPQLKQLGTGSFERAWGGISGLQFGLAVVWTQMRERRLTLGQLADWMSARTAKFLGLQDRKGAIVIGYDADLVVWNPDRSFVLEPSMIRHRHALTPYQGSRLFGVVEKTFLRGQLIAEESRSGKQIDRPRRR